MSFEARLMHAEGIVEEGWGQVEAGPTDIYICKMKAELHGGSRRELGQRQGEDRMWASEKGRSQVVVEQKVDEA